VKRYDDLVGDLRGVLDWAAGQPLGPGRFLLGHSNGGQVVLRTVLADPAGIDAMILSNPAIRIAVPIPAGTIRFGRMLLKFAPWFTLKGEVRPELLTRDPVIQAQLRADPLRHSDMSAPLFFGMVAGEQLLLNRAPEIQLPTLMLIGGLDPVIDPATTRALFDRLGSPDKLLHLYPRMLHEPFNELGREQVYDDLVRWLEPRLASS
jgi:alpha-beta hydrolase superfamily lysophospholipase